MKAVQVVMDAEQIAELDALEEVRRESRSAVIRKAVREYLRRRRDERIAEQYRRAYTEHPPDELVEWIEASTWHEE